MACAHLLTSVAPELKAIDANIQPWTCCRNVKYPLYCIQCNQQALLSRSTVHTGTDTGACVSYSVQRVDLSKDNYLYIHQNIISQGDQSRDSGRASDVISA